MEFIEYTRLEECVIEVIQRAQHWGIKYEAYYYYVIYKDKWPTANELQNATIDL